METSYKSSTRPSEPNRYVEKFLFEKKNNKNYFSILIFYKIIFKFSNFFFQI